MKERNTSVVIVFNGKYNDKYNYYWGIPLLIERIFIST